MKRMMIILLALALTCAAIAVAETSFPETRQAVGTEVSALEDLPVYDYDQREIWLENGGQRIYGVAYVPNAEATVPLAILSHGLGGNYANCLSEAEQLASHGIAAYCFDFRGGGGSRSDGDTTQMSVMTEVSDLEAVLAAAQTWDFVDPSRIVLMGFSQGGIVSAITAENRGRSNHRFERRADACGRCRWLDPLLSGIPGVGRGTRAVCRAGGRAGRVLLQLDLRRSRLCRGHVGLRRVF